MAVDRPDALVITTPSDREIVMTRVFNAPRSLVFDAWTTPEMLGRWMGPRVWKMIVCEIDLRVGGRYRFVWRGPDGSTLAMGGVYQEIVRPERLVSTEVFDDPWYAGEALSTLVLVEQDGKTTSTVTVRYDSQEIRDAVLKSPMESGVSEGYNRLDELLASAPAPDVAADPARDTVAGRYRTRADIFERKVAAVQPGQWSNQSPCEKWDARDVVRHIVEMHGVMLRPLDRQLNPAPSVDDDPLAAFKAARADVEAVLADPALASQEGDTPSGRMTVEQHIDRVVSADMVFHGWDLARATGQDDTMDPGEVARSWAGLQSVPAEVMTMFRTPGAFGPGVEVFGPEVKVPEGAPLQDRLLGMLGRKPY